MTAHRSEATDRTEPGYPPPPWTMQGQLWVSLFRVREPVDPARPRGVYGAAFVRYEPGSDLTYSELLVARPVTAPGRCGRQVGIVDIWVDSAASVLGGRELWAIPKERCDFASGASHRGPLTASEWAASVDRRPLARASFTDVSRFAPRAPFRSWTCQPAPEPDGEPRFAAIRGSARVLPCRGRWEFAEDGPLSWLRDARPVASFRMADFRMSFG